MPSKNLTDLLHSAELDPRLRAIAARLTRLDDTVQRLRGTLHLHIDQRQHDHHVADANWAELPGLEGMYLRPVPELCTERVEYCLVHGLQGARCPLVSVPQRVRIHVREGAMIFARGEGPYLPYHAGDVIDLDPGEAHGFVITEDYYALNEFEPRFTAEP